MQGLSEAPRREDREPGAEARGDSALSLVTEACEQGLCGSCFKGRDQYGGWCQCACHPSTPRGPRAWFLDRGSVNWWVGAHNRKHFPGSRPWWRANRLWLVSCDEHFRRVVEIRLPFWKDGVALALGKHHPEWGAQEDLECR